MRLAECSTSENYTREFKNIKFGEEDAFEILNSLGIASQGLTRKIEGSSLLFRVQDLWLKITPPFWSDSVQTEIKLLQHFENRLTYSIPKIIHQGKKAGWDFVISTHVAGTCYADMASSFSETDRDNLVNELSNLNRQLFSLDPIHIPREFGTWSNFATARIKEGSAFHRQKGVSEFWIAQIESLMSEVGDAIRKLDDYRVIHADLNHEHLLFEEKNGWRLSGVIDFADGMLAPKEIEMILPFLVFFRGHGQRQKQLFMQSGLDPSVYSVPISRLMMGLTLCNRFLHFEEWFAREIKKAGMTDIRDISDRVFSLS